MDCSKHHQTIRDNYPEPTTQKMPSAISMVISNYNHSEMVRRILWQLSHTQKYVPVDFEVIVTDSGSDAKNVNEIECMLLLYGRRLNMKYVYVDCTEQRKKDQTFNGYACCINAAVKQAKHDTILYCDSSVLIPPDYLWDLSYPQFMKDKIFVRSPLKNANKDQTQQIIQSNVWEDLERFGPYKNSSGRPSWSVKKQHFVAVGGMDEEMCHYGAVDDDFVLRLIMLGCTNFSGISSVIHLFHEEENRHCHPLNNWLFHDHAQKDTMVVNKGKDWGRHTWIKDKQ